MTAALDLTPAISAPPDLSERLDAAEVATLLGYHKRTVYRLFEQGILPGYKPGGRRAIYFFRSEIEAWVGSGRQLSAEEMKEKADAFLANLGRPL